MANIYKAQVWRSWSSGDVLELLPTHSFPLEAQSRKSLFIITAFQPRLGSPHTATVPGSRMSQASPFLTQLITDISLSPDDSICTATFILRHQRESGECFSGINSIQQRSSYFECINTCCDVSEREIAQSYDDLSTCCQNGDWQLGKTGYAVLGYYQSALWKPP